jgi:hypothetical protein
VREKNMLHNHESYYFDRWKLARKQTTTNSDAYFSFFPLVLKFK